MISEFTARQKKPKKRSGAMIILKPHKLQRCSLIPSSEENKNGNLSKGSLRFCDHSYHVTGNESSMLYEELGIKKEVGIFAKTKRRPKSCSKFLLHSSKKVHKKIACLFWNNKTGEKHTPTCIFIHPLSSGSPTTFFEKMQSYQSISCIYYIE